MFAPADTLYREWIASLTHALASGTSQSRYGGATAAHTTSQYPMCDAFLPSKIHSSLYSSSGRTARSTPSFEINVFLLHPPASTCHSTRIKEDCSCGQCSPATHRDRLFKASTLPLPPPMQIIHTACASPTPPTLPIHPPSPRLERCPFKALTLAKQYLISRRFRRTSRRRICIAGFT